MTEDPRVKVSPTDLKASFDLSQRIAATLAEARRFYGEKNSVLKQLDGIKDAHFRPLADRIRQKPAPGEPTFESVDGILTGIENDLEATDGAPMAAQQQAFDDARSKLIEAQRRWNAVQTGPLAQLNAALKKSGRKPLTIPPASSLDFTPPAPGQDLP